MLFVSLSHICMYIWYNNNVSQSSLYLYLSFTCMYHSLTHWMANSQSTKWMNEEIFSKEKNCFILKPVRPWTWFLHNNIVELCRATHYVVRSPNSSSFKFTHFHLTDVCISLITDIACAWRGVWMSGWLWLSFVVSILLRLKFQRRILVTRQTLLI